MTDRQKFVYDLALQHVSAELANGVPLDKNPAAYALDIFTGYVSLMLQWTKEPWMPLLQRSKRFDLCLLE